MPTYSYQCKNCGHIMEAFQKMNDAPLQTCPHCSKETLARVLLSAPSFKLKGGGWYKTDYASDKATPAETTATPNQAATSDNKGEAKQEPVKHE